MSLCLVTTALEETWRTEQPILFLGEWCRLYSRRQHWRRLNAEVLPYHWDDRRKLHEDFLYLEQFCERLLEELREQLNRIHGVDHGVRYWRILIGPWLGFFVPILFDRWESIQAAASKFAISESIVLTGYEETFVPADIEALVPFFLGDEWNHRICAAIIEGFTAIRCVRRTDLGKRQELSRAAHEKPDVRAVARRTLVNAYSRAVRILARETDAFLINTHLRPIDELILQLRLGQFPQRWYSPKVKRKPVDWYTRDWKLAGESRFAFEECTRALIPRQIPTSYLEGYSELKELAQEQPWPKQPRFIWSTNAFFYDEVFKVWAAQKAERGAALVTAQHGGHYGIARWSSHEAHEVAISDCFLSWGWSDPDRSVVKAFGQLRSRKPVDHGMATERKSLLLVTGIVPRQSYWMWSAVVASQWLAYFDDQCAFVGSLPERLREALTVRLHVNDYGWDQVGRWRERFPSLRLDEGKDDIGELVRQSRLYISTYNATTFLESLSINMPTVIYWNQKHWELRDSAIRYFEELERVGIFHATPQAAARHVEKIWDDVQGWWFGEELQQARQHFCARYAYSPDHLVNRLARLLREQMVA